MRGWRLILIGLLYALGVCVLLDWKPWRAILAFSPWPLLVLGLVAVLYWTFDFGGGSLKRGLLRLLDASGRRWMLACGALTGATAFFMAHVPLEGVPHVPDDICYLWQARTFALGQLYVDSHDIPEFFHHLFMVNDGRWYSLFQPGWPALLSLSVPFGLEFAVNPVLGGIATALVYPIGRRVFSERVAKVGMLLITLSPMHLAISATLLAHSLALVLTEIAILSVFRLIEKNRVADAVILGLALGWLFTTRALNSLAMLAIITPPLLVYVARGRVSLWKLAAGVPLAMVFLGLQLGYNQALTGKALYWPQDHYFDISEPKKGCHSLGFGDKVGCPVVHPDRHFPDGFTPRDAVGVFHERMGTFLVTMFGFQMIVLFIGASFLSRQGGWRKGFLLSVFLSLIVAYSFWYFHGLWGRYYYEAAFAIFLLIAGGMAATQQGLDALGQRLSHVPRRLLAGVIPIVGISYIFFNALIFLPYAAHEILSKTFFSVDSRLARVTQDIPENSVIFLKDWYQMGFFIMRPGLPEPRVFVQDLGTKHNRLLMQYYPDWNYYSYAAASDTLSPIKRRVAPSPVFVEMEWKILNGINSGHWDHAERYTSDSGEKASNDLVLFYEAREPGDWTGFDQFLFVEGYYTLRLVLPTGPDMGRFSLKVGEQTCGEVDGYSPQRGLTNWEPECGELFLTRGHHRFTLSVTGKHPDASGYRIGADLMTLELRTNGPAEH